jgi:hypothetical protein
VEAHVDRARVDARAGLEVGTGEAGVRGQREPGERGVSVDVVLLAREDPAAAGRAIELDVDLRRLVERGRLRERG